MEHLPSESPAKGKNEVIVARLHITFMAVLGIALIYVLFCTVLTFRSWNETPTRTKIFRVVSTPLITVFFVGKLDLS